MVQLSLLPFVVLSSDVGTRRTQLTRLSKGQALGLGLTDPDAIAACSMGNISSSDQSDYGNIVSGRVMHFLSLKSRMRLVIENVNLDTLMAVALLSLRADGVGQGLYEKGFDPDAQTRRIELGHLPEWSPATDSGEYCDPVSVAQALQRRVASSDAPLERRIEDICQYLLTGTFEGSRILRTSMEDERAALKREYLQAVPMAGNRIAVNESAQAQHALPGAAFRADVVVWVNTHAPLQDGEGYVRRITIWQKHAGLVNFAGVMAELAAEEAGWTGTTTECGSSGESDSRLEVATIVRLLLKHHVDGGRGAREYLDEALDDHEMTAAVRDGSSSRGSDLLERVLLYRALS